MMEPRMSLPRRASPLLRSRRRQGLLCAAALAAVATRLSLPDSFVTGIAQKSPVGDRVGLLQPLAARGGGFLDDIGKGMQDAAVTAATGLSAEESAELMERSKTGKMNFDDYLTMLKALSKMSETAGFLEQFTGSSSSAGLEVRIDGYREILEKMTEEERQDPSLLQGDGAAVKARVKSLAERCDTTVKEMDQFLMEVETMSAMFEKLGSGKDMNTVRLEMAEQRAEAEARNAPRQKRREVKRLKAKNRGAQPEWMTL